MLIAPPLITFSWLQYQKDQVKHEIKHRIMDGMDRDELVRLSFSRDQAEDELKWEHSKEFEYEGEMYDVVERNETPDSLHYWCWWDYEETELNRKLAGLVNQALGDNPQKQENQKRLFSYLKNVFSSPVDIKFPITLSDPLKAIFGYRDSAYSVLIGPPTPPPKG